MGKNRLPLMCRHLGPTIVVGIYLMVAAAPCCLKVMGGRPPFRGGVGASRVRIGVAMVIAQHRHVGAAATAL